MVAINPTLEPRGNIRREEGILPFLAGPLPMKASIHVVAAAACIVLPYIGVAVLRMLTQVDLS